MSGSRNDAHFVSENSVTYCFDQRFSLPSIGHVYHININAYSKMSLYVFIHVLANNAFI